jgi:hypothetical protein
MLIGNFEAEREKTPAECGLEARVNVLYWRRMLPVHGVRDRTCSYRVG